jgi:uncharacterized protein YaeQ
VCEADGVALTATIYTFDIDLADSDRGIYESLPLRVARHPSETGEYLIARVLAYLLEYKAGIEFTRGLSDADEPAIVVRDLTGGLTDWIEIGTPDAARLHKASKATRRVAVYIHKDPGQYLRQLTGATIHRAAHVELYTIDRGLIAGLVDRLERRLSFSVSVTDRELYVTVGSVTLTGGLTKLDLAASAKDR